MQQSDGYTPKDYTDIYKRYIMGPNSLARRVIRKYMRHATEDEFETLAHDIFLRLVEHRILEKFDPTKVPNGDFGGAIQFTGRSVCINHMNKKGRNPITGLHGGSLSETSDSDDFVLGSYNLDTCFPSEDPDIAEGMDNRKMIELLTIKCEKLEEQGRNKREKSLLTVLKMLQEERTPQEIAEKLEVTTSTVHNYTQELKEMGEKLQTAMQPWLPPAELGPRMPIEE